ncbi:MAG: hypothetical protein Q4G51_17065 [Dermatophilus congolensis]|nr:hypothetical protein [Dermatophilus congolensis]
MWKSMWDSADRRLVIATVLAVVVVIGVAGSSLVPDPLTLALAIAVGALVTATAVSARQGVRGRHRATGRHRR